MRHRLVHERARRRLLRRTLVEVARQNRELVQSRQQLLVYAQDLARTYRELQRRIDQMALLREVSSAIARPVTVAEVMAATIEGVQAIIAPAWCGIFTPAGAGYVRLAAYSSPQDDGQLLGQLLRAPLWEGPGGGSCAAGLGELSTDLGTLLQMVAPGAARVLLATVPVGPDQTGTLLCALASTGNGGPLSPQVREAEQLSLLSILANQAGEAIHRARLYEEVQRLAITDEVTGLYNHRYLRQALARELEKSRRLGYPLGLLMLDVDDFKRYNDRYGHPAGDRLLRLIAMILLASVRSTDTVARYGGEEFSIILPGCTPAAVLSVAEKVRLIAAAVLQRGLDQSMDEVRATATELLRRPRVVGRPQPGQAAGVVTLSIGGAASPPVTADPQLLLQAADQALYTAKRSGKDRVYIYVP
jgi:diguanylate cyclase (GGDEF)-like protein